MTKKERFVLWLNKLGRGCNRITIVVLYITIMIMLGTLIYGANQQKATSNVTVNYSRPSYTVTFDPAGGGSSSSKIVKLGDNYGDLPTPTKTGYTFNGWQTSDGTAVTSTTQNTTIGDHTLSASWTANSYTLTYALNGGTLDGKSGDATATVKTDESVAFGIPTRTGYIFNGWSFSGGTVTSGTESNAYAYGTAKVAKPSFAGGTNTTNVYNNSANGTVTHSIVSGSAPNNTGYYLEITNTGSASPGLGGFYFGHSTSANMVLTSVIIAKIPVGYSIGFYTNNTGDGSSGSWITSTAGTGTWQKYIYRRNCGSSGTFSSTNFYAISGTVGTTSNPVKWQVAYAQVYDSTGATASTLNTAKFLTFTGGTNITATANWTPKTIKITLNKNGGTGGTSEFYYKYGTNIFYSDSSCSTQLTKPVLPTKQGYTLVHYYGDGTCGGNNGERYAGYADVSYGFASDLCTDIYQDATLYASWSAIATTISANTTSVSYIVTRGTSTSGSITVTAGGGGGQWTYSVVSATKTVITIPNSSFGDGGPSDPNACISLSTTGETTGSVVVTCSGTFTNDRFLMVATGAPQAIRGTITYEYIIRATSVYNGTTADITLTFIAQTKYYA